MEPLLLVGYSSVFGALLVYVLYLRRKLMTLERRLNDIDTESESSNRETSSE